VIFHFDGVLLKSRGLKFDQVLREFTLNFLPTYILGVYFPLCRNRAIQEDELFVYDLIARALNTLRLKDFFIISRVIYSNAKF